MDCIGSKKMMIAVAWSNKNGNSYTIINDDDGIMEPHSIQFEDGGGIENPFSTNGVYSKFKGSEIARMESTGDIENLMTIVLTWIIQSI